MRRFLGCLLVIGYATAALGATFTVNTDSGTGHDLAPGDGICLNGFGTCSLLAAVEESNANVGTDTIAFEIAGGGSVATITPTQLIRRSTTRW